jgi:Mg-chelatase subunit ChlD
MVSKLEEFFNWFPQPDFAKQVFHLIESERIDTHVAFWYPGVRDGLTQVKEKEFRERPAYSSYHREEEVLLEALTQYSLMREYDEVPKKFESTLAQLVKIVEPCWDLNAAVEDSARATAVIYERLAIHLAGLEGEEGSGSGEGNPGGDGSSANGSPSGCEDGSGENGGPGEGEDDGLSSGEGGGPGGSEGGYGSFTPGSSFPNGSDAHKKLQQAAESLQGKIQSVNYRGELQPDVVEKEQQKLKEVIDATEEVLKELGVNMSREQIEKEAWKQKTLDSPSLAKTLERSAGESQDKQTKTQDSVVKPRSQDSYMRIIPSIDCTSDPRMAAHLQGQIAGTVRYLQRAFEQLQPQGLIKERRREDGELDMDLAVDAYATWKETGFFDDRIYTQVNRKRRDVFVGLVIDASGSTDGRILTAEQEGALALTAALEKVGDNYSLYAFRGNSILELKRPNEVYSERVKWRIGGLSSGGGTPLGEAVEYAASEIELTDAKTKLLLVLSDGYPADGRRATKAFTNARSKGIHTYLLAVEGLASKDAEEIAGQGNYLFFENAATLATKLPQLYKRLTC